MSLAFISDVACFAEPWRPGVPFGNFLWSFTLGQHTIVSALPVPVGGLLPADVGCQGASGLLQCAVTRVLDVISICDDSVCRELRGRADLLHLFILPHP